MAKGKAPGPDGITADLIKNGGKPALEITIRLVQHLWRAQKMPQALSKAHIFLIPKDATKRKDPQAQRPISLTNFWLKVVDKVVQKRLSQYAEENRIFSRNQAGFRPQHS
jgi:hypothetical protein